MRLGWGSGSRTSNWPTRCDWPRRARSIRSRRRSSDSWRRTPRLIGLSSRPSRSARRAEDFPRPGSSVAQGVLGGSRMTMTIPHAELFTPASSEPPWSSGAVAAAARRKLRTSRYRDRGDRSARRAGSSLRSRVLCRGGWKEDHPRDDRWSLTAVADAVALAGLELRARCACHQPRPHMKNHNVPTDLLVTPRSCGPPSSRRARCPHARKRSCSRSEAGPVHPGANVEPRSGPLGSG